MAQLIFRVLALNLLFLSRIHSRSIIFFANPLSIHYLFANSLWDSLLIVSLSANSLWIHYLTDIKYSTFTSGLSFGRLLRFHHVGIEKGHIIGFSQFQQELLVFLSQHIYQIESPFFKYTYVFESSFSDIYFTGWFDFSFIFSVFSGLTSFISGIWYFFCFFIFLFNSPWSNAYTWVDFILMEASHWPWKEVGSPASQRESLKVSQS